MSAGCSTQGIERTGGAPDVRKIVCRSGLLDSRSSRPLPLGVVSLACWDWHRLKPLVNWGPVVNDHADQVYDKRPGMTTVAQMRGGGWIMTWEDGNNREVSFGVSCKISKDPEDFASAAPQLLRTTTGLVPIGCPTVTWSPAGGKHGTIVVSAGENEELFINRDGGAPAKWTTMPSVVPRGHSRQVQAVGQDTIMTIGGGVGTIPPTSMNKVDFGYDSLA